jgi:hypothetical protein
MEGPSAQTVPARRPTAVWAVLAALLACGSPALGADEPAAPPAEPPPAPAPEPPPAPPDPAPTPAAPPEPPKAVAPELDVITLNNGTVIRGSIVAEETARIVVQTVSASGGVGRITLPRDQISTVKRAGRAGVDAPSAVLVREAWFLLRSGGEVVGTRHVLLRSVRSGGEPGFRIEDVVVQLPQGRRIPRTRIERTEDTDPRFLPRRLTYREAIEPSTADDATVRFERSVVGTVEGGVWRSVWKRGQQSGRTETSLPPEVRGVLGLREWLLRDERTPGLVRRQVLDAARDGLVDAQVGWTAVGGASGRPDELQWVEGDLRRIARLKGNDVLEETLGDGVTVLPVGEAEVRAVEQAASAEERDPSRRDVRLPEQGLALTLPGPDWTSTKPVTSGFDAGWREIAFLASKPLLANARIEWNPEGAPPGQTAAQAEAALLERLRSTAKDLSVTEARRGVEGLPGAWRLTVRCTLRDTAVNTFVLFVPRGSGAVVVLAAAPESGWEAGRLSLDRLLASARGL